MFVTYLFHSYSLGPHNIKCLYAFETGIADTELSTYEGCSISSEKNTMKFFISDICHIRLLAYFLRSVHEQSVVT